VTWHGTAPPPDLPRGPLWRVMLRGTALGGVTFGCLGVLLLVRLVERPLCGARRPVTPWITQFVCRTAFRILGMGYRVEGTPCYRAGVLVANHGSWLDIFTLNACQRLYYVSKDEVRHWPGIGWLARATGTLFIARDARAAGAQVQQFRARLAAGHRLMLFPEGTSSDGLRVLPFKPTLFAALYDPAPGPDLQVQPISVIYQAPPGADPRLYGWWGDMAFGPHLVAMLGLPRHGSVTVRFHPPLGVAQHAGRKPLARACEDAVRAGLHAGLAGHSTGGMALR